MRNFLSEPVEEEASGRNREHGDENREDHRPIEIERLAGGGEMFHPPAKEKFKHIDHRDVHEADESEVGEVDKLENKGEGDEEPKDKTRSPALQNPGNEDEDADFQEGLSEGIEEEEEGDAKEGSFDPEEVR